MRNRKRLAAVLLILAVMVAACGGADGQDTQNQGVEVGKEAREFTLKTLDGNQASLSDYRGQVVVLNFWATWCPPCRAEMPDFEQVYQGLQDQGLVVLGVNAEEPTALVQSFVDEFGVTFPMLLDETGKVGRRYRASGLPMTLVIDRDGVIRERHVGFLPVAQLDEYLSGVMEN